MKICTCSQCRYTFRYPLVPTCCPDCGARAVRRATSSEIREFRRMQKIIEEEIRSGLCALTSQ